MENTLKRIEVCENMAAMTRKLSEEIIYINESLFSELSKLRDIVKKYEEGQVKDDRRARFVAGYFRFKRGDWRKSGMSGERR